MTWIRNPGRIAGLVYLSMAFTGPLTLVYIPAKLFVPGNAAATSANIAAHEMLFRAGIFCDLLLGLQSLAVTLTVYYLFKHVDQIQAVLLVILGGLMVAPIYFMNTVTDAGALLFARSTDYLAVFTKPQREALVVLFLRLHHHGILANEIFWGLWLIPFGILLYKSRSFPRILAVWLVINSIPYLAVSFTGVVFPAYESTVWNTLFPLTLGEVAVMLWLVVMGTTPQLTRPPAAAAQ